MKTISQQFWNAGQSWKEPPMNANKFTTKQRRQAFDSYVKQEMKNGVNKATAIGLAKANVEVYGKTCFDYLIKDHPTPPSSSR